jgi:uncharacterized protein with FMN-binding domain
VRRVMLAVTGTVGVLVMLLGFKTSPQSTARSALLGGQGPAASGQGGSTQAGPGPTGAGSTGAGSTGAGSKSSGTVNGQAIDTQYGPVQVQVTFSGGRITNVQAIQIPQGTPRDQQINAYAGPILAQEAIQAQSAQIDVISGATFTSEGYAQSLQSAIDQASG